MALDRSDTLSDLAAALVHVSHARGVGIEYLRAEQLLAETNRAWPGSPDDLWGKWLSEGMKNVGLHPKLAKLSYEEAIELLEDGALLAVRSPSRSPSMMVLGSKKGSLIVSTADSEKTLEITPESLSNLLQDDAGSEASEVASQVSWLIVDDLEVHQEEHHPFHDRPIARLIALTKPEWSDIWVVAVFAFFAGILSLATPIAVESLVNMVMFGRLLQPLLILSMILFGFLAFAALMKALQTFVVEIIQRRLFARVTADLAFRFPRVSAASLDGHYGPELANRFFDIVTLQKVVAQLLLDGIGIVLATFIGMAVLAFYHPWLLGFDVLLLILVVGGVILTGRGAIASGIDESKQKYRLAAWLEDLMHCPLGFKSSGAAEFALDRANKVTASYLDARRRHFSVLFRQLLFILGLQTIAGTVLLGFGGWLVIRGQLTLGQLVAAELIVATILGSLSKLGKHIEGFYDVVASVDKLGHLFDLDTEPQDGLLDFSPNRAVRVRVTDVQHASGGEWLENGVTLSVDAGERIALLSTSAAGSNDLLDILYGLRTPDEGHVEIEHADPRDLRPDVLRRTVALVRSPEIFTGTIAENVQMGRSGISTTDVRAALYAVGLLDDVLRLPDGLDTPIDASGTKLIATQRSLLMLARAIAGSPGLLLIDGTLDVLSAPQLAQVCETLTAKDRDWTIIVSTNRDDVAAYFGRTVDIESNGGPDLPQLTSAATAGGGVHER